eukprot:5837040-Amphidinium_carterae.1
MGEARRRSSPSTGEVVATPASKRTKMQAAADSGAESSLKQKQSVTEAAVESKVYRALLDHFKDLSPLQIDSVIVNKLTLRQKLTQDKRAWMEDKSSIVMGKKYYMELKAC